MAAFHSFPYLPFELRARIWELTVEPRTVEVRIIHREDTRQTTTTHDSHGGPVPRRTNSVPHLLTSTPVPATLHTCREARNLRMYQQAFSQLHYYGHSDAERRYVWLNPDIDMVSIGRTLFSDIKPVALQIRRLKFERVNRGEAFFRPNSEVYQLGNFANAREMHVVCLDDMRRWHGATDHEWPCGAENVLLIDAEDEYPPMRLPEMEEFFDTMSEEEFRERQYELQRREAEEFEREEEEERRREEEALAKQESQPRPS